MSKCQALATKVEVKNLSKKLDQKLDNAEKPQIIKASVNESVVLAVAASGAIVERLKTKVTANTVGVSRVGTKVNTVTKTANKALGSSVKAAQAAKKANFNALYASSRAASNATRLGSVASAAFKALNLIGTLFSIVGTLATAVVVAKLSAAVVRLDKLAKKNEKIAKENRRIIEKNAKINQLQERAITINRDTNERQQREIDQINKTQAAQQIQLEKQNEQIINNQRITEEKIQAAIQQINQFKTEINLEITKLKQAIEVQEKKASELTKTNQDIQTTIKKLTASNNQQDKSIASLNDKTDILKSQVQDFSQGTNNSNSTTITLDNKELIKRVRSLDTKVTNFNVDIQTLKGGQSKLTSSLERTRSLDSKVTNFDLDIQTLKGGQSKLKKSLDSEIPKLKQQQNRQQIDITQLKQNNNDQVNNQEVTKINQRLDQTNQKLNKLPDLNDITIAVAGLDILRQIKDKSGKTTCQAPALIPPVAAQTKATNATLISFQGASLAQGKAIQNTVTTTKNIVSHANHGLQAIKNAADVAWKATHADKALQILTTAVVLNNAAHLGFDVLTSIGDIASLILATVGIRDSSDNPLDINAAVGKSIKNWIIGMIGQQQYTDYETKIKTRIRTYQAGANLYSGMRSLLASAEDIAEDSNIKIAKVANSLRDSGTVEADSYGHMNDKKGFGNKIFNGISQADEKVDAFRNVADDVYDFREDAEDFNRERKEFIDTLNTEEEAINKIENTEKGKIERLPDLTDADKAESPDN